MSNRSAVLLIVLPLLVFLTGEGFAQESEIFGGIIQREFSNSEHIVMNTKSIESISNNIDVNRFKFPDISIDGRRKNDISEHQLTFNIGGHIRVYDKSITVNNEIKKIEIQKLHFVKDNIKKDIIHEIVSGYIEFCYLMDLNFIYAEMINSISSKALDKNEMIEYNNLLLAMKGYELELYYNEGSEYRSIYEQVRDNIYEDRVFKDMKNNILLNQIIKTNNETKLNNLNNKTSEMSVELSGLNPSIYVDFSYYNIMNEPNNWGLRVEMRLNNLFTMNDKVRNNITFEKDSVQYRASLFLDESISNNIKRPKTENYEELLVRSFCYLYDNILLVQERIDTALNNIEIYKELGNNNALVLFRMLEEQIKVHQYKRQLNHYILNMLLYGDSGIALSYLR